MEKDKYIFLDIDGVLNYYGISKEYNFGPFIGIDPRLAAKIQRIIRETGCKVVLSSTWRLDEDSREHVREKVCDFVACTIQLPGARGFRGDEVKQYVDTHPEVGRYAILDDDNDFHPDQPLFRTNMVTGLTTHTMKKVIKYLNQEWPYDK